MVRRGSVGETDNDAMAIRILSPRKSRGLVFSAPAHKKVDGSSLFRPGSFSSDAPTSYAESQGLSRYFCKYSQINGWCHPLWYQPLTPMSCHSRVAAATAAQGHAKIILDMVQAAW